MLYFFGTRVFICFILVFVWLFDARRFVDGWSAMIAGEVDHRSFSMQETSSLPGTLQEEDKDLYG